ncbi:hypothetical protein AYK25_06015, partial [Thermoplasmatales archaeon SM1-50]
MYKKKSIFKKAIFLLSVLILMLITLFVSTPMTKVVKAALTQEWDKTFGTTGLEQGQSVQQTMDGGYILLGSDQLIKTDKNGNEQWTKILDGVTYSARQTTDGGYIIVGFKSGNTWLIKTDDNGNEQWDRSLTGILGYSVKQTTDGGYIITGMIDVPNPGGPYNIDLLLIKTDTSGYEQWYKNYGKGGESYYIGDWGKDLQQTTDGGYIITGITGEWDAWGSLWLLKTDANGNEQWNKSYESGIGESVQQTTDDGYIIRGAVQWDSGISDLKLIKTDANGNEQWTKLIEDRGDGSAQQTTDGGYIVVGSKSGDIWLMKTDDNSDEQWNRTFGGTDSESGAMVQQTSDLGYRGYIIIGTTFSFGAGSGDIWLIKIKIIEDDDGDGLPNDWEIYGYDANGDGIIDVDLPAMGADPQHEDIF